MRGCMFLLGDVQGSSHVMKRDTERYDKQSGSMATKKDFLCCESSIGRSS